jgi:YHS domain-containing protein
MLRTLLFLILSLFAITLLRGIIGIITKAFTSSSNAPEPRRSAGAAPAAGVLRKDPVCGVYVSEALAVRWETDGQILFFCSEKCREEYRSRRAG